LPFGIRDRRAASARRELRGRSFQRILIVKPSSLGDVVDALPVLYGLRRRFPEANIDWLISSGLAPLLRGNTLLHEVVEFDRRRFGRLLTRPRAALAFFRFLRELRSRRYDLVIDLQGLFRSGFLTFATGAPQRLGFGNAREAAWIFYNRRMNRDPLVEHAVDRNYQVADWLGFDGDSVCFSLELPASARSEALALFEEHCIDSDRDRVLAVVPGAQWDTKRWPPDRFAALIGEIKARSESRVVLLGGTSERALCQKIAADSGANPVNLSGRTSLLGLAAVLERSSVVLCHDSGAMHLAVALGRPLVCLSGPTNPRRTGPYGRLHDVVRLDLECSPCYLRRLRQCRFSHRCMQELSVEVVLREVRARLHDGGAAREKEHP
jgi:lipopolysaccharide heptosyltransferase I